MDDIIPVYAVVDVSKSVANANVNDKSGIDALNEIAPSFVAKFQRYPNACKVPFSLLSFSSSAKVEIPLKDVREIAQEPYPVLEPGYGSSYTMVFTGRYTIY